MPSSAEISVVDTLGSPKRLNSASVTSRMRSAVRRGARLVGVAIVSCACMLGGQSSIKCCEGPSALALRKQVLNCLPTIAAFMPSTPAISFQIVGKTYSGARGAVKALDDVSFDVAKGEFFG